MILVSLLVLGWLALLADGFRIASEDESHV